MSETMNIILRLLPVLALLINLWVLPFACYIFILVICSFLNKVKKQRGPHLRQSALAQSKSVEFTFVIPAHNEESGISETVRSCFDVTYPSADFKVVVIADNCTDFTAKCARSAGAKVYERFDDTKRSKGYALEWYFEREFAKPSSGDHSTASAPQPTNKVRAFVIVDADSIVAKNILNEFKNDLEQGREWIQCRYDVRNPDASERTRLLTYALSLFNGVWLWGQSALGMGCALRGNGMCFREEGLRRFPWRAYGLTEDLEFSWLLRLAGEKVSFNPNTAVYGEMVSGHGKVAENQRKRWEDGRKSLRKLFHLQIWRSSQLSVPFKVLCSIDLFSAPLAKLTALTLCGTLLSICSLVLGIMSTNNVGASQLFSVSAQFGLSVSIMNIFFLICYLASPFVLFKLPFSYVNSLFKAPAYIFWKAAIALGGRKEKKAKQADEWIRTERERR